MAAEKKTPLHHLNEELGARFVPFAGYKLPVQFKEGVIAEHLHCRSAASLFDVSHMGQIRVTPRSGNMHEAARALERLVPSDLVGLPKGRQRYTFFTNTSGGIEDDLMVANRGCDFLLIVNASRCAHDLSLLRAIDDECDIELLEDRALLALQGPASERVLASMFPEVRETRFMDVLQARGDVSISRSGYTGEDGFEISLTAATAPSTASRLLADPDVAPAGLGARDTLRLEAGLCLYGADLDAETSPVEAGLSWAIPRVRRPGGDRAGEYPGSERIERELANGPERRRIGLLPEGRAPMRSGTVLFEGAETDPIGSVTSGAYGPSLARPVSMGYVQWSYAEPGRRLAGEVRGRRVGASVVELPFVPANFKR